MFRIIKDITPQPLYDYTSTGPKRGVSPFFHFIKKRCGGMTLKRKVTYNKVTH